MPEQTVQNPKQQSPLTLAFLGDAAYELMVRETITARGSMPPGKLHRKAVELVRASFQAAAYDVLEPLLTEEEADILRRGRNNSAVHPPKNADMTEYRKATGVEALFGYLHMGGQLERERELFAQIMERLTPQSGAR